MSATGISIVALRLDEKHPMNQLVIAHARDSERLRFGFEPIAAPEAHHDPYREAGSHPEWETWWTGAQTALQS